MDASLINKVAGFYKIVARSSRGDRIVADWFPNTILNAGLDRIAAGSYLDRCDIGVGGSSVNVTDTMLQTTIASSSTPTTVTGVSPSAPYYGYIRKTFAFFGVGDWLTEVGVGWGEPPTIIGNVMTGGLLFSRSKIKDLYGNETAVRVFSDEQLLITYELRSYVPTVDRVTRPDINGVPTRITIRPALAADINWIPQNAADGGINQIALYSVPIAARTELPIGIPTAATFTSTVTPYVTGSYVSQSTIKIPLDSGNIVGGIRSAVMYRTGGLAGVYQIDFDPAIPKTSEDALKFNLSHHWGRA